MQRPADLAQRLQQVEAEYFKIQYPFLLVDEARRAAGLAGNTEMVYGQTPPETVLQFLERCFQISVRCDYAFSEVACYEDGSCVVAHTFDGFLWAQRFTALGGPGPNTTDLTALPGPAHTNVLDQQ